MDRMRSKLFCANPSYFVEKIWRHAQKYVLYAGVPRFTVDFLGSFLYYSFQENSYFAFRKLGTIYERSLCYYPPQAYPPAAFFCISAGGFGGGFADGRLR